MKHLTPEICRTAQTYLSSTSRERKSTYVQTCTAIDFAESTLHGDNFRDAFSEACLLIRQQHETAFPFAVIKKDAPSQVIQGGRFMYLELLALAIEDGRL